MKTGWKNRNLRYIQEAVREAEMRGVAKPTLVDISPGVVTRFLDPYFSTQSKWLTGPLSALDSLLRTTEKFPVVCHEVDEIASVSARLGPAHLYVLYADEDVAEAIPESDLIVLNPTDVSHDRLLEFGDIVFCYNTIKDTENPKYTLENVLNSVKMGGLLSIDEAEEWHLDPRTNPMFLRISDSLYVKEF